MNDHLICKKYLGVYTISILFLPSIIKDEAVNKRSGKVLYASASFLLSVSLLFVDYLGKWLLNEHNNKF